jgi:hypothetical protein
MNNDNNKEKNLEWMISQMVDKASAKEIGNMTELTFSEEQAIAFCDDMVQKYAINNAICSPTSNLIKNNKSISENFSNNDCRFITTSVVEKKMNMNASDADLNLSELKAFYIRNNMKDYKFSEVLSKGAIEQYWGNRPHQREIMEWRWDNGLAFMDYKERVLTYLSDVILLNNEAEATLAIKKIYGIQTAISLLREDFTTLVNTDLLKQFHPTTRGVIKGFATGRINLDKVAKDAIYRIYLETRTESELDDIYEENQD